MRDLDLDLDLNNLLKGRVFIVATSEINENNDIELIYQHNGTFDEISEMIYYLIQAVDEETRSALIQGFIDYTSIIDEKPNTDPKLN